MIKLMPALALCLAGLCSATTAAADSTLRIDPIMEQSPGWGWAAAGEMIMSYYEVPNTGPDTYQCSVANFLTGAQSCSAPNMDAYKATLRIVESYQPYAFGFFGETTREMRWQTGKVLPQAELIHEIEFERPVVAAIQPPGADANGQVALIVGYQGTPEALQLVVNDPKPYEFGSDPYVDVGAQPLQMGQYLISYESFVRDMRWTQTIHHIKPD